MTSAQTCGRNSAERIYVGDADSCARIRLPAPAGGLRFFSDGCGCGYEVDPDPATVTALLRSPEEVETAPSDSFRVFDAPKIKDDILTVRVEYGGGCRPHGFDLLVSEAFAESVQVRALARLVHAGFDDRCYALFEKELRFDLRPLRDRYLATYHAETGSVLLRIDGVGSVPYAF